MEEHRTQRTGRLFSTSKARELDGAVKATPWPRETLSDSDSLPLCITVADSRNRARQGH